MDLSARKPGPDVVRALAMAGVVMMNYHGYLILRGAQRDGGAIYDFFDPWTGPLATRFAATFVLTAGVGVTLMTASSVGDPRRTTEMRWRLVRRGILLYAGGMLFDFIWSGTILPFYGAMFVLAAVLFTLRARWLLLIGFAAALSAWLIRWWRFERELDGHSTAWLTNPGPRSPRGLVFDVFVNGTHPLLPWLAYFCVGIVLGRLLNTTWWRPAAAGAGFVSFAGATLANSAGDSRRTLLLLSDGPFDRGVVYVASALGTALIAFTAISWLADEFADTWVVDGLRRAGQMSLTIYLGHALVFNLLVDWVDLIEPDEIATALVSTAAYWLPVTALAVAYQKKYGRGPVERIYRALTG
ncbi:MAG: DUF418 domain-containing protein [Ilumatobacter sp.]|uniref:DUF418 domain-containing protein n=1 Tax=Ilumatobacter sp. TaxID=1967498 RepID=UPI00261D7C61|nr:DUF418 domain-containing protein [Ilumatobacter sp.]MDJ0770385.1 DUF418 domain-containing protein [Ilumatobacter sp.]